MTVTGGIMVAYLLSSHAVLWAVLIMGYDAKMVARLALVVCGAVIILAIVYYTSCIGSAIDCAAYIYVSISSIVFTAAIAIIDITYAIEAPEVPEAAPAYPNVGTPAPAPESAVVVVPSAPPMGKPDPLRQRRRHKHT